MGHLAVLLYFVSNQLGLLTMPATAFGPSVCLYEKVQNTVINLICLDNDLRNQLKREPSQFM